MAEKQTGQPVHNEDAVALEKARRGVKDENEEENKLMSMYLEDSFKQYVQEKYAVQDKGLLENDTILQMIYALEWYDIPRSAKADLIEFNPYLNEEDHEKLYFIKQQHLMELSVSGILFSLVSNRILNNQGPSIFRKRYVRFPTAICLAGLLTYGLNQTLLKTLLYKDLKEDNLDKYFALDLNADMMKQDLAGMGIRISATHFNIDESQKRVNQAERKL